MMLSGPDLIAYIGVPLTLTGLVQIFILGKALWIFCHLYLSVPKELRSFYSLYPDPSSGTVLVIVKTPVCTRPGLLEAMKIEKAPLSNRQSLQKWWLETGENLKAVCNGLLQGSGFPNNNSTNIDPTAEEKAIGMQDSFSGNPGPYLMEHLLRPKRFKIEPLDKLRRSWMDAAIHCGFTMSHDPKDHPKAQNKLSIRLRVDQTFDLERSTPMAMRWSDFVWFALALGVNVLEFPPIQTIEKVALSDVYTSREAMLVYNDGVNRHAELIPGRNYAYSIQRALAWFEVMCFRNTFGTVSLRRLGDPRVNLLRPDIFDSFNPKAPDFDDPLDAALTWTSYLKTRQRSTEESAQHGQDSEPDLHQEQSNSLRDFHVSQRLLEIREKSLCYLKRLDDGDLLEGILFSLFEESFEDDSLATTPLSPIESTGAFLSRLRALFRRSEYVRNSIGLSYTLEYLERRVRSGKFGETESFFKDGIMELRTLDAGSYSDHSGELDITRHIQRTCFEFKCLLEMFGPHRGKDFVARKDDESMRAPSKESGKATFEEASQPEMVSVPGSIEVTSTHEGDSIDGDARETSGTGQGPTPRDIEEMGGTETQPTPHDVQGASGSENGSTGRNSEQSDSPEVYIVEDAEESNRPREEPPDKDAEEKPNLGNRPSNILFHKHILVAIQDWETFPTTQWTWRPSFSQAMEKVEHELWSHGDGLAQALLEASKIAKEGVYAAPDFDILQSFFDSGKSEVVVYLH
ncbi:hypothetical protein HDK90DRAFT_123545 [Phyllosticta capitalensis]|uniref:Uncharacterized protein n=1 Tax=Phyllosticta capitalensis TaxID=121624 RepID=A0ABR1YXT7_9PEZI